MEILRVMRIFLPRFTIWFDIINSFRKIGLNKHSSYNDLPKVASSGNRKKTALPNFRCLFFGALIKQTLRNPLSFSKCNLMDIS